MSPWLERTRMTEPTPIAFTDCEVVALLDLLAEVKKAFRVCRIADPTPQQVLTALEKRIEDQARARGPEGYSKGRDADVQNVRARQYEQMREPAFLIGLANKL